MSDFVGPPAPSASKGGSSMAGPLAAAQFALQLGGMFQGGFSAMYGADDIQKAKDSALASFLEKKALLADQKKLTTNKLMDARSTDLGSIMDQYKIGSKTATIGARKGVTDVAAGEAAAQKGTDMATVGQIDYAAELGVGQTMDKIDLEMEALTSAKTTGMKGADVSAIFGIEQAGLTEMASIIEAEAELERRLGELNAMPDTFMEGFFS